MTDAEFNLNEMFGLIPSAAPATEVSTPLFDLEAGLEAILDGSASDPSSSADDEFDLDLDGIADYRSAETHSETPQPFGRQPFSAAACQAEAAVDRQRKRKASRPDAAAPDEKPTKKARSKRAEALRLPARFEVVPADETKQAKAAARDTAVLRLTTDPFFRLQEALGPIGRSNFCGGTTRAAGTSQCHFHFAGKADKVDPLFSIKWSHADRRYQAFCRTGLEAAPAPAARDLRREIVCEKVLAAQLSTLSVFTMMKKAMMARMEAAEHSGQHDGLVAAAKTAASAVDAQLLGSFAQPAAQPQQAPGPVTAPSGSPDSPGDHATTFSDASADAGVDGNGFTFCASGSNSNASTCTGDAHTGAADDTTSGFFFFEQQQDGSDASSAVNPTATCVAKTPRIDPGGQLQQLLPDLPTSSGSSHYYLHPLTANETAAIIVLQVPHMCARRQATFFAAPRAFGCRLTGLFGLCVASQVVNRKNEPGFAQPPSNSTPVS